MTDYFPNAYCGGHAGRAHKKQLKKLQKMKSFTVALVSIRTPIPLLAMWSAIAQGTNGDAVALRQFHDLVKD